MANRFNAKGQVKYNQQPLPTGYSADATTDFVIPPVGLEDIDTALFNLFDKELPLSVAGNGADIKKVPVIFAGGEKWALLKRNRPLRDKTNSLILPLITIGRSGFSQSPPEDLVGRGINQKTGEIIIRRKLDKSDRNYQNTINRIFLKHQSNLAVNPPDKDPGQLTTLNNDIGELSDDPNIRDGGYLLSDRKNNIYETLVVPSPQFITANYEITVWTQYTHHMNQIMETLLSSFLPQMQGWKIETPKGYWFLAQMANETFDPETNFDDMSQGERLIKQKFQVKVHAYIFASNAPGVPIPVRRYVSSPVISFDVGIEVGPDNAINTIDDPFLGSDDPTLPLEDNASISRRRDQRRSGGTRLFSSGPIDENDPALQSQLRGTQVGQYSRIVSKNANGKLVTKYVRISKKNPYSGETTYAAGYDLGKLSIVAIEE